ncbi:MAG TPA: DUF2818 domain-containing protein [Oxalobacteraceae bacterium]|nr:DUF2818 domain-containing protein [Oxalobacteraceae bacterium]
MSAAFSSWFLIGLAVLAANLPFLNERLFALVRLPSRPQKPFWLRLVELVVLYFAVGAVATMLEARIGSVFRQGWEFYAVTGCLFLVLAFPGFVFRYLRKRHG